jgi:hypothetical protein
MGVLGAMGAMGAKNRRFVGFFLGSFNNYAYFCREILIINQKHSCL